ncbi:adenylate kinase [Vibrio parahaemolyticus]|uniref:adenylate kinase n=1 Tax=Vibrio parahaemolyticus TaxID=670 RepID=UPI0024BCC91E|nr:adenylate kinase [Vibrio parahaemolyticus]WHT01912.1 adenylate kinase [Vibrio parahaemolyticus]
MKIAFMGASGSGKDFLSGYLIKNHNFIRLSFSDQLKRLSKYIYPWMERDYPPEKKMSPLNIRLPTGELINHSPRDIWLNLDNLRKIEEKIFIRMLAEEMKEIEIKNESKTNIIITDIRSNSEFLWCKENNFTIVYINRKNNNYEKYDIDKHVIENKQKADYRFDNDSNDLIRFKSFFEEVLCRE